MRDYEVIIIGGGMVGLVMAQALANNKIHVAVLESKKPHFSWSPLPEARVSAINLGSERILKNLGIWSKLDKKAVSSLQRLVVWDGMGGATLEFDAADSGTKELGSIIENREIIKKAWELLEENKYAHLITDTPTAITVNADKVAVTLSEQPSISGLLCVGADGSNSWVRSHLNLTVRERIYKQDAIIAVVHTEKAHQQTGWQVFLKTGPLALLPLDDAQHCAIVWSTLSDDAERLMQTPENQFNLEINNAFGARLGLIKLVGERKKFPLKIRDAEKYVMPRVALIGDAAHVIHPLAGQGVNLGFFDAACLADCIQTAKQKQQDIGHQKVLRRYERWRKGSNLEMTCLLNGLNKLFMSDLPFLVYARNQGFNLIERTPFCKKIFMQTAMGEKNDLPSLATLIST